MLDCIKILLLGIIEGITEWLPISSTGHLILFGELLTTDMSPAFEELFEVVIQLGAILAVLLLYFGELNPFPAKRQERMVALRLWGRILLAVLPSALIGFFLDDWLHDRFYSPLTVAWMLILWGIGFLVIEHVRRDRIPRTIRPEELTVRDSLGIGAAQTLSLIPGTSRSGATILGGMLLGLSRQTAARFSFFLAIPTMAGATLLKSVKFFAEGNTLSPKELLLLLIGTLSAFLTSLAALRFLMEYVRKHSFFAFGIYRIVLGIAVFGYYFVNR